MTVNGQFAVGLIAIGPSTVTDPALDVAVAVGLGVGLAVGLGVKVALGAAAAGHIRVTGLGGALLAGALLGCDDGAGGAGRDDGEP